MRKIWLLAFSLLIFLLSYNIPFVYSNSEQKVNYELPYPGLLPDSPIYFLRIIRDKTVGFLISDPLKKAEFDLLQADKRLNAGIYLFNSAGRNEKKINLAISTISKAENYFEQAIGKAKEARLEGMEINGITRRLKNSAKKHQEELISLEKRSPQNFKASFEFQLQRVNNFEKEAVALTLK